MNTMTNTFHSTEHRTKYTAEQREQIDLDIMAGKLDSRSPEYRARRRAKLALCSDACTCSNAWGARTN